MSDKLTIKPRKLKHLAVGQVWLSIDIDPFSNRYHGPGGRHLYYEVMKKHGSVWILRAIIVTPRYDYEKVLMWPKDETELKRWDKHVLGGHIARNYKYITNNKDIFLKNYNILYSNKE